MKTTSKLTDVIVLGNIEDHSHARLFADLSVSKAKKKILQNAKKLKDTAIFMYEGFCSDTMELRKSLWEKVLEYHQQGKYVYLNYRTIVARNKS